MKRILPYLKPYRGKMLLGMLLIAVSSVCSLLLPTIMSDILDGGIYTSDWDYILRCCGRMLLVTLLSLGAVAAGTWCRTQVVSGFCADLRAAVFGRVNALTFEEVSRIGTSALLTRSTHDVGTLAWVADMLSSNIITIPVLFFGGVVLAFSKDSTLALIILVAMPIITLLVLAIGRRVEPLWKISDQFCDKQNDLVRERLHGIRVIRAFNREEQEQGRIAEATRVMAEHIIEANTKMGLVAPIAIALMNLVAVAILYFVCSLAATTGINPDVILIISNICSGYAFWTVAASTNAAFILGRPEITPKFVWTKGVQTTVLFMVICYICGMAFTYIL